LTDIDNQPVGDSLDFVRRLRSYIAVLLLALWMPVTMCCEMEMAGVLSECGACQDEKAADGVASDCDVDGSAMIESGSVRLQHHVLLVKAPDLADFLLLAALSPDLAAPPALSLDRTTAPPEWIRSWQFVMRAALPSRAPSFIA
jgi:hypothetical protein